MEEDKRQPVRVICKVCGASFQTLENIPCPCPYCVSGVATTPLAPAPAPEAADRPSPCADAIDKLWRDVILARKPNYGDWEYPGFAYRHLKAEFDDLIAERDRLRDACEVARNTMRVLIPDNLAIERCDAALAAAPGVPASGGEGGQS